MNWDWEKLHDFNYQIHDDLSKIVKKEMFELWKFACVSESHWGIVWEELPPIGRYRRIKKFLNWYNNREINKNEKNN